MNQAKWIWYLGDYEIYHGALVNSRRVQYGAPLPCFWHQATPYATVCFEKAMDIATDTCFTVKTRKNAIGCCQVNGKNYPLNTPIALPAGHHEISIPITVTDGGFPCIFIDSDHLKTDASWQVHHNTIERVHAGDTPAYTKPTDDPYVFPFRYTKVLPVAVEEIPGGKLYDFGRELFAKIYLVGTEPTKTVPVTYGESREEALDREEALVRTEISGRESYILPGAAFRYLAIGDTEIAVEAWAETLPLADIASFSCDRERIKDIWKVCAYTFHQNSRECYLDGIKRDRWIWSGDAYQSYMANYYLYFEPDLVKRTIVALLGKPPYEQHINTINDYSLYLLLGAEEYEFATADRQFICDYYPRFRALYDFVCSRLDENGMMVARPGDWIFIDWSEMDKGGPLCAEQILLWATHRAMAKLAAIAGEDPVKYQKRAEKLEVLIPYYFWDYEKGAFIDTYTTGNSHLSRHGNIFAILYDFVGDFQKKSIVKNVLDNPSVTAIETPYFKFFELKAYCMMGRLEEAQNLIESYWGGMISQGATAIWELYNPQESGAEHLAMYGMKYGKSLCHAWGSGPIYLLGRFCVGVFPTAEGYETFRVEPRAGIYKTFRGVVPIKGGTVEVSYEPGQVIVKADKAGGVLAIDGREYPLLAGEEVCVRYQ